MDEKLIEQSPLAEKKPETSGSWLWKNLKPFGCILCLVCLAAFMYFCFASGPKGIPDYEPAQTQEYYLEHPEELASEIKANVQPRLEAVLDCYAEDGQVVIVLSEAEFTTARATILKYFDEENLKFVPKN